MGYDTADRPIRTLSERVRKLLSKLFSRAGRRNGHEFDAATFRRDADARLDSIEASQLDTIHTATRSTREQFEQALGESDAAFEQWKATSPQRVVRHPADAGGEGGR